jgi:hypothetical protein
VTATGVLDTAQQLQDQQQQRQKKKKPAQAAVDATASQPPPGKAGPASDTPAAAQQEQDSDPWWRAMLQPWVRAPPSADAARSKGGNDSSSSSSSSSVASMDTGPGSGEPDPQQALINSEPLTTSQRAWWEPLINSDFVKSLPIIGGDKGSDSAKRDKAIAATQEKQQQEPQQQPPDAAEGSGDAPWWDVGALWGRLTGGGRPEDDDGRGEGGSGAEGGPNKPVEAIIIPPDLPLEEIAKEVAKLKEESWRSKEGHVESLWARAVERNDRSWVMLLCFLITVGEVPPGAEALVEQVPLLLLGLLAVFLSGTSL